MTYIYTCQNKVHRIPKIRYEAETYIIYNIINKYHAFATERRVSCDHKFLYHIRNNGCVKMY